MSDSDSDDDLLLNTAVFSRKQVREERAADQKRASGLAYLQDTLDDERARQTLQHSISQIKQEFHEERLTQAEEIAASASKRKVHSSDETSSRGGLATLALRDQLATALDTAQSSNVGTRHVLGRGKEENKWSTVEFAVEKLNEILGSLSVNQKPQQQQQNDAFVMDIVTLLQTSIKTKNLQQVLMQRKLAKLTQKHARMFLPRPLTEWLYCLACNPIEQAQSDLCAGAFQTLFTILFRAQGGVSTKNLPLWTLDDIFRDLQTWFDLQIHDEAQDTGKENQERLSSLPSALGLEHFLLLWEQLLLNNIVVLDDHSSAPTAATQCVVALACAALDPCFYKGQGLKAAWPLQRTILALLSFVATNVVTDPNQLSDWIATTTAAILKQCMKLAFQPSTEHHCDDNQEWLCLSLVVRAVSTHGEGAARIQNVHRQFRADLAIQALQTCLEVNTDWDQHVQTMLAERGETELPEKISSSLAWRAIASAYAGFLTIPIMGSSMSKNGQKSLATAQILVYCVLAGVTFQSSPIDPDSLDDASHGLFGTTQDASLLLRILQVFDAECRQWASRLSLFSSDPNFSRAEYLLSCLRRYNDHVRVKARTCAGEPDGSPVSVQKSIKNYFGTSQGSDDMDGES